MNSLTFLMIPSLMYNTVNFSCKGFKFGNFTIISHFHFINILETQTYYLGVNFSISYSRLTEQVQQHGYEERAMYSILIELVN